MKSVLSVLILGTLVLAGWAWSEPNDVGVFTFNEVGTVTPGTTADNGLAPAIDGVLNGGSAKIIADSGGNGKAADSVLSLNQNTGADYVDIATSTGGKYSFASGSSLTVAAWIKTTAGGWDTVVAATNPGRVWHLGHPSDCRFTVEGVAELYAGKSTSDGKWHHVVGVFDNAANKMYMYVDGLMTSSKSVNNGNVNTNITNIQIGAMGGGDRFTGLIDQVYVINVALTAGDVIRLYAAGLNPVSNTPGAASNPDPLNGEVSVSTTKTLSWTAGSEAQWAEVYFGTNAQNVADANSTSAKSDPNMIYSQTLGTTMAPGTLAPEKTYYWRVDSDNLLGVTKGTVWSFTTGYQIGTSTSPNLARYYDFNTVGLKAGDKVADLGNFPWQDGLLNNNGVTQFDADRNSGVLNVNDNGVVDCGLASMSGVVPSNAGGLGYTVAMWFKSMGGNYYDQMFGFFAPGNHYAYTLSIQMNNQISVSHAYVASVTTPNSYAGEKIWRHLAVTFDDSVTTNNFKIYIDGVQVAVSNCDRLDPYISEHHTFVGGSGDGLDFNGLIDDVVVMNIPLDAAGVAALYSNGVVPGYAYDHKPVDGQLVKSTDVAALSWKNPAGATGVDVWWYGNSPANAPVKIVNNQLVTSVAVPGPLSYPNKYYWRVDGVDGEGAHKGKMVSFEVGNFPPSVDAGSDVQTWLTLGMAVVTIDATVVDDGQPAPVTALWTVVSEPAAGAATFTNPAAVDAQVSLTAAGTYVLQLTANDGQKSASDTMTITVYADACAFAQAQPGFAWKAGDVDRDCDVDMEDFAAMAANWMACYSPDCP